MSFAGAFFYDVRHIAGDRKNGAPLDSACRDAFQPQAPAEARSG